MISDKYTEYILILEEIKSVTVNNDEREALDCALDSIRKDMLYYNEVDREFKFCEELSKQRLGNQLRNYIKQHKAEIKRYGIRISLLERYPNMPLILSIISLILSIVLPLLGCR